MISIICFILSASPSLICLFKSSFLLLYSSTIFLSLFSFSLFLFSFTLNSSLIVEICLVSSSISSLSFLLGISCIALIFLAWTFLSFSNFFISASFQILNSLIWLFFNSLTWLNSCLSSLVSLLYSFFSLFNFSFSFLNLSISLSNSLILSETFGWRSIWLVCAWGTFKAFDWAWLFWTFVLKYLFINTCWSLFIIFELCSSSIFFGFWLVTVDILYFSIISLSSSSSSMLL